MLVIIPFMWKEIKNLKADSGMPFFLMKMKERNGLLSGETFIIF